MPYPTQKILAFGYLCAVMLGTAACAPRSIAPLTVEDLMEDRVTLDGLVMKCNQIPIKARTDADCLNARIAIEKLAKTVDPAEEAKRSAEFERSREQLRLNQEEVRQAQQARAAVDPYNLPLVPVEPPPGGAQKP